MRAPEESEKIGCERCSWTGVIEQGDGKAPRECECGIVRRLAYSLPDYISKARVERAHLETALYATPRAMGMNLYVTAHWDDICAIILALQIRHIGRPIFVTNDGDIKSVYVGSKAKASRTDDFKGPIYNDLQDLMGMPGLMIIRLNAAKGVNKALPRALEEALTYRLDYARPTWLISDPESPFDRNSVGWSDATWSLIARRCVAVSVPRILPKVTPQIKEWSDLMDGPLGAEPVEPSSPAPAGRVPTPPRPEPPIARVDPSSLPDVDVPAPKARPKPQPSLTPASEPRPARKPAPEARDDEEAAPGLGIYGSGVSPGKKFRRNR